MHRPKNSHQSGTTRIIVPNNPHAKPTSSRADGDVSFLSASITVSNNGLMSVKADAGPAGPNAIEF